MRLLLIVFALGGVCVAVCGEDLIVKVYVNGELQKYEPGGRIRNGTTYVPLRQGATSLGFEVQWLAEQNSAQVCSGGSCLLIPKHKGIVVDGRLFLPLRQMSEAFGAKVHCDGAKKIVTIKKARKHRHFE